MTDATPTPAVSIRGRFRRSVDLARDVYADGPLDGYVVTVTARQTVRRLARALRDADAPRAWSVVGPYGGGKSAFALFAARLLGGHDDAGERLAGADAEAAAMLGEARGGAFCPVLVGGSREPLGTALLRGLHRAACLNADALGTLADEAETLLEEAEAGTPPTERNVTELFERAAEAVHDATGGGLFVVVDELGKLLEYAALHPDASDLFALQRLAERAARSDVDAPDPKRPPLLLLTILHQAFDRYAGSLPPEQREEWRKVQGRFEDVAYAEPVDETLRLLSEAIRTEAPVEADGVVDAVLGAARLPERVDRDAARRHLAGALPLHPAVSVLVGPLFRRMAQNERTLFAFLASGEPLSFLDVVRSGETLYRLDHLYDYLTGALGASLTRGAAGRLWAETEAALGSLDAPTPLMVRLVKTIALLDFAGDLAGLRASPALLEAAADAEPDAVRDALDALVKSRVVIHQVHLDRYRVWQGSDFDLGARLAAAYAELPPARPLAEMLAEALPPAPVVARRHSYKTGTTRAFAVRYATETSWRAALEPDEDERADGQIVYVLPDRMLSEPETEALHDELAAASHDPMTFFAVPDGVGGLRERVRELAGLDWVREHAEELEGDAVARRELDARRAATASRIETALDALLRPDAEGGRPCTWIHRGERLRFDSEREMQQTLSAACAGAFPDTPAIWNELVNRHSPSSSAVRALKELLVALIEESDEEGLGFEGYPAPYGLYLSILASTGMHREIAPGMWAVAPPEDEHAGCRAAWDAIFETLQGGSGQRVGVPDLYARLMDPPFGMREGLLPIFLVVALKYAERDVAVYQDDTFVPALGLAEVELLLRVPEKFEVQWVALEGGRKEVLGALAPVVGLPETTEDLLPVVVRLLGLVRDLPAYTQQTATLSDRTLRVREALRHAVEPATLLFGALPEACGLPSFLSRPHVEDGEPTAFAAALRAALTELGGAYDALLAEIEDAIAEAFGLRTEDRQARRHELNTRALPVLPEATQTNLRAFLVRATDAALDPQSWLESLAALPTKRPPAHWVDADRGRFAAGLREIARRFRTLEPIVFETSGDGEVGEPETVHRVRLGVTELYEAEQEGVVSVRKDEEEDVSNLVSHLERELTSFCGGLSLDAKLTALGRVMRRLLRERDETLQEDEAGA